MITDFYNNDSDGIEANFTVLHIIPEDTDEQMINDIEFRTKKFFKNFQMET